MEEVKEYQNTFLRLSFETMESQVTHDAKAPRNLKGRCTPYVKTYFLFIVYPTCTVSTSSYKHRQLPVTP